MPPHSGHRSAAWWRCGRISAATTRWTNSPGALARAELAASARAAAAVQPRLGRNGAEGGDHSARRWSWRFRRRPRWPSTWREAAGITLIGIARDDGFEVFTGSTGSYPRADGGNMSPDKLAYMANQIGSFFAPRNPSTAVASITDHLLKFWDPRMRRAIVAHLGEGGGELDRLVREAVERLEDRT